MELSLAALALAAAAGVAGLLAGRALAHRRAPQPVPAQAAVSSELDAELARFRDVLELGYDWVWETDTEHRFVYLTPRLTEVTGQPVSAFIGRSRFETAKADLGDPGWARHLAQLEAREPFRGFVYSAAIGGLVRWYRTSGKPRFDAEGNFQGYRGIAADVTDQVLAEQRTVRSQQQLQRAIDAISHGLALYDPGDRLIAVNAAYRAIHPRLAEVAQPGVRFEDVVRAAVDVGLPAAQAGDSVEQLVAQRLAHHGFDNTHEQTYADGRTVLVTETKLESGELLLQWNDVTRYRRRERALSLLLEAQAAEQDVVAAAAQALAVGFGYRCGGVIRRLEGTQARVLALWDGERIRRNLDYDITGTPCETVYSQDGCYFAADTCQLFPQDAVLVELGAQAFRGAPLPSDTDSPVGHVIAFSDKPDGPVLQDEDLLELIASWVAIELKRREADQALAASEARFRDLVEIDTDWYWEMDADLCFSFVSEGTERLIDRRRETVLGRTLGEALGVGPDSPHWREAGWAEIDADMSARLPFREARLSVRTAAGERHLRLSGRPLFDEAGRFAGYRGVTADETAQLSAQRAVEASSEILGAIVENMPEGVTIVDADLQVLHYNERFLELLDIPAAVLARHRFEDVIRFNAERGDYGDGNIEEMVRERIGLARHPVPHRFVRVRPNGTAIEVRGNPLPTGGFVTTYADVTEHQRMQSALQASEARYRLISELTSDFLYSTRLESDRPNELEWFAGSLPENIRLPHLNGTPQLDWDALVHPYDRAVLKARRKRLHAGEPSIDELRVISVDGSVRWLKAAARPEMDPNTGRLVRILGAAQDITERKHAEFALLEAKETAELANRTKSEFLANMSHELRTPLNAVIGFSEIMKDEVMGPLGHGRYKTYAQDIWDSGTHLLNIINDILDVSKAEAGMLDLCEEELSVEAVVETAVRLVRQRAETADVVLSVEVEDKLPPIRADVRRMKQVLLNLLSNAVKFTPEGRQVRIAARRRADGGLEVEVSDEGIGISPDDLERVLEPFTQVDSSLSRRHDGTGLGLPLTRALIEMHDGKLTLESELGKGTRAVITLPPERLATPEADALALAASN